MPTAPPTPALPEIAVDARGHRCPVPTLRLRRALELAQPGQVVALTADDPLVRIDAPHFLTSEGHALVEIVDLPKAILVRCRKRH